MTRKWQYHPDFAMTDEQVVDKFLDTHDYWFLDQTNGLCGKKEESKQALLQYLKDGTEPTDPNMLYVVLKFKTDFVGQIVVEQQ